MKTARVIFKCVALFLISFQTKADSLCFVPYIQRTAMVNKAHQLNKSLWDPFAYGINNRIEINSYLFLNPIMPNVGARISFPKWSNNKLQFSTTHSFLYYSPWLKFWQKEGTGGLISPQMKITELFLFNNGICASYIINRKLLFTGLLSVVFTTGKRVNPLYSVDIPMVYPRMAPAFTGPTVCLKTNLQVYVSRNLFLMISLDYYKLSAIKQSNFAESNVFIFYNSGTHFKWSAGPKITYGQYAFGSQFNFIPCLNIIYSGKFGNK